MVNIYSLDVGFIVRSDLNNYSIIQRLGSGGNGIAYLVLCTSGPYSGNFFTLKFLTRIDQDGATRFLNEIQFIKTNKHPSILAHYDDGKLDDFPFVVTEYLRHTLHEVIKTVQLKEALVYSVQLLSAVDYLQQNEFVHRDIKPKNILLDNSNAILGDFGLIKKIGSEDTVSGDDIVYLRKAMPREYRTPQLISYMNGEELNKKTDIFQLGLVLGELFIGKPLLKPDNSPKQITDKSFAPNNIIQSKKYGARINGIIKSMIQLDESKIPSTKVLLNNFQSVLTDYFADIREIEYKITI